MRSLDWRFLSSEDAGHLQDAEAARWLSALHWGTGPAMARIEFARKAGTLPGLVVRDEQGTVRGWTFYLVHDGVLQVGAFVADSTLATATLLDGMARSPEAAASSAVMLFVFSTAPDFVEHLIARGFTVDRYRYLRADLANRPSTTDDAGAGRRLVPGAGAGTWAPAGWDAVAALLQRAYAHDDAARPFARGGTRPEWLEYVAQLVTTSACGSFFPEASCTAPSAAPPELDGATLITRLTPDTAHLAQIAVAPAARGQGLARRLLTASSDAAGKAGCARITLLVSERNVAAGRLYREMGFHQVAAFVSASRNQPRRSTAFAPGDGSPLALG
jgi:ribosomal protein S18 acetylase RimI-like enzyme